MEAAGLLGGHPARSPSRWRVRACRLRAREGLARIGAEQGTPREACADGHRREPDGLPSIQVAALIPLWECKGGLTLTEVLDGRQRGSRWRAHPGRSIAQHPRQDPLEGDRVAPRVHPRTRFARALHPLQEQVPQGRSPLRPAAVCPPRLLRRQSQAHRIPLSLVPADL